MKLNHNLELANLIRLEEVYSCLQTIYNADITQARRDANTKLAMERLHKSIKHSQSLVHKASQK